MKRPSDSGGLKEAVEQGQARLGEAAWWQVPLFVVLLSGVGLLLVAWSRDRTEFIYALF